METITKENPNKNIINTKKISFQTKKIKQKLSFFIYSSVIAYCRWNVFFRNFLNLCVDNFFAECASEDDTFLSIRLSFRVSFRRSLFVRP